MQQDYILRIVEQVAQAILAMMEKRKAGQYQEAREEARIAARYLLKTDLDLLLLYDDAKIRDCLDPQHDLLAADLFAELELIEEEEGHLINTLRLRELCLSLRDKRRSGAE